jgi:beta-D-xylosidase 4
VVQGVDINSNDDSGIAAALAAVSWADVVVLALGNDLTIEGEGTDRTALTLPGLQVPSVA